MWTPGAGAANGGNGYLVDEAVGFSAKVRTHKGGTRDEHQERIGESGR
jgi:hypothetical protein